MVENVVGNFNVYEFYRAFKKPTDQYVILFKNVHDKIIILRPSDVYLVGKFEKIYLYSPKFIRKEIYDNLREQLFDDFGHDIRERTQRDKFL